MRSQEEKWSQHRYTWDQRRALEMAVSYLSISRWLTATTPILTTWFHHKIACSPSDRCLLWHKLAQIGSWPLETRYPRFCACIFHENLLADFLQHFASVPHWYRKMRYYTIHTKECTPSAHLRRTRHRWPLDQHSSGIVGYPCLFHSDKSNSSYSAYGMFTK